jgi:predicted RNA-binding protein with PIN domain/archaellum component FlaC
MADLPADVARSVARGVAAYIRATPVAELPAALAPLKKTLQTPKGEARHRVRLLAVLEDDALRALVAQWLAKDKPPLKKDDLATLELVTQRPEGWLDRVSASVPPAAEEARSQDPRVEDLERRLEREREAHRKAREELKRAKDAKRQTSDSDRRAVSALEEEVEKLRRLLEEREREAAALREEVERAQKELQRVKRKARGESDEIREQVRKLKEANRALRKQLPDASGQRTAKQVSAEEPPLPEPAPRRGPRQVLRVPKGRLAEAPETLTQWLERERVTLVVDGYNVTRNAAGYGHLSFEQQRNRLREQLKKLANRVRVPTVLVWDGGDVPPGTKRRSSGFLREEYSEPDRSGRGLEKDRADRHIVGLLKELPPDPVVVVTSDRALQEVAVQQRGTIATSEQLLALLR